MKTQAKSWLAAVAVGVGMAQIAHATVLDFYSATNIIGNNTPYINYDTNGYGDNVATSPQGFFNYDLTYGHTPDVTVSVDYPDALWVVADSSAWITNISPKRSVLGLDWGGVTNAMTFTTIGASRAVTLRSFYAGVFGSEEVRTNRGFSSLAAYIDGNAVPAWTATAADLTNFPAGGRFFQDGVSWTQGLLTGTNTVRLEWVPNVGNTYVALGNIGFSQIPEPTTSAMLVAAGLVIASSLRRRA